MIDNNQKKEGKAWWQPALEFFAQIAGWIVFPILVAIFLGSWLDEKFGTGQKIYFISIAVSFVITIIGLLINTRRAMKQMDAVTKAEIDSKNQTKK